MNIPKVKLPPKARCGMFQKSHHGPSQSPTLPRGTTFLIPRTPFTVIEHSALCGSPARTYWLLPKGTEAMKRWAGLGVRLRWALAQVALAWLAAEGGRGAPVDGKFGAVMPEWTQAKTPPSFLRNHLQASWGETTGLWEVYAWRWPFKATMNPLLEGNCLRFTLHQWRQRVWPFWTESVTLKKLIRGTLSWLIWMLKRCAWGSGSCQ